MQEVRADQAPLRRIQGGVRCKRVLHLNGAGLEDRQQISVPPFEIFENLGELARGGARLESDDPVDDMIGAGLIRRIEVSGLGRRFERSDNDPRRIGTQVQALAVQEPGLRQRCPLRSVKV